MKGKEPREDDAQPSRLAIVGISCMFPKADDLEEYWANIKGGVDAITEIPASHWSVADYHDGDPKSPDRTYAERGGFIRPVDFNPLEFGIAPKDIEATDTSQLLGMVAAQRALDDAGYGAEGSCDRNRVGVILGVTGTLELVVPLGARLGHPIWRRALDEAGVDAETADNVVEKISDSYVGWQENSFPGLLGNVVAGRVAGRLDLGGTNCVVDSACASSLSALHLAALELTSGRSDMIITGGVDTFNDIFMYMCFSKTPALSKSGNAKPFAADADGTIIGEGLGMVVLKRLEDAERDGDRIYAVIRGVGSSSDGRGNAVYAPSATGQAKALRNAYDIAGITPDTVELVEAHGTGTSVGDATEVTALTDVYRDHRETGSWCAIGSVKSQIGHTKAAAGSAGLIKAVMALQHKVLPPTIKVDQPNPKVAPEETPFYVNTVKRPWLPRTEHPRRAVVSAFGFGGSNFHCVLEEYEAEKAGVDWGGDVQIHTFSGADAAAIAAQLEDAIAQVGKQTPREIARASRARFAADAPCRLAVVDSGDGADLVRRLRATLRTLSERPGQRAWHTPDGIYFGSGPDEGKLAFLFPGQGSQYVGMLRDLACQFPEMQEALAAANTAFWEDVEEHGTDRLSDLIYPQPAFDDDTQSKHELALRETRVAQPALGAVALGALRTLESFGVTPDVAAGHSFGELPALCVAGSITDRSLHALSNFRGRLMGAASQGDRGAMLAVQAPLDLVQKVLADQSIDLIIANRNAPRQAVLSGASAEVDRAATAFEALQVRCRKLPVAAAFHSPLVADAADPFEKVLGKVRFAEAQLPVYANTTATTYPENAAAARKLLAGQLAAPVEFVQQIENMYREGVRTFLEVGPGARLSGLVAAILGDRPHQTIAVDASSGKRPGVEDLARVLAHLVASGRGLALQAWDPAPAVGAEGTQKKPAFTVPISGANQRGDRKPEPPRPPQRPAGEATARRVDVTSPTQQPATNASSSAAAPQSTVAATPQQPVRPLTPQPQTTQERNAPMSAHGGEPADAAMAAAIRATQDNMSALQRLQEQTARIHQQFLEGQSQALTVLQGLMGEQSRLYRGEAATAPAATPSVTANVPANVPASVVPATSHVPASPTAPVAPPVAPPPVSPMVSQPEVAPPPAAVPAPVAAADGGADVQQVLLDVVAEKTGYPVAMLSLEMELDADLGIDSIKRVEILSSLQEKLPEAPAVQPEELGQLQTLAQIVERLSTSVARGGADAAAPIPAASGVSSERVQGVLLEVVAEKTGYPTEMLNLDMELDADLGIDSIKRVEILSALQEKLPEAPAVQPEELGALGSLRQIVEFLAVAAPATDVAVGSSDNGATSAATANHDDTAVANVLIEVVAEKTGYPSEMLNLDMELDSDLGIDSIKRVEILSTLQERLPELPAVQPEDLGALGTLQEIVSFLSGGAAPATPTDATPATQAAPVSDVEQHGASEEALPTVQRSLVTTTRLGRPPTRQKLDVPEGALFWITAEGGELSRRIGKRLEAIGFQAQLVSVDDDAATPGPLDGVVVVPPKKGTTESFLWGALRMLGQVAPALRAPDRSHRSAVVAVTRLDGAFGFGDVDPIRDATSGALAGLTKTVAREWPEVSAKAIDLAAELDDLDECARLIVEELQLVGPDEVGLTVQGARTTLQLTETPIDEDEAGGFPLERGDVVVVSGGARGVTADCLAAIAVRCAPTFVLLGRSAAPQPEPEWLQAAEGEAEMKRAIMEHEPTATTPKIVGELHRERVANREMLQTLDALRAAGAAVEYRSVDVTDRAAVAAVLAEVKQQHGAVRALIHGAGVLADQKIEEKTEAAFARVYRTKVDGFRALAEAVDGDALRLLVLFSSTTARYGRVGQVDYAMANEVLNKLAQQCARSYPECRVLSVNWGPWDGGMVTPELARLFEKEGIALIDPAAGARYLVDEVCARGERPVEVVVLGGAAQQSVPAVELPVAFQQAVDVQSCPVLEWHRLDGRPVVPFALTLEWLAHAALHRNPGLHFHGFDDVRVLKGVILDSSAQVNVAVLAGQAERDRGLYKVRVELRSRAGDRDVLHAAGCVILADALPAADAARPTPALDPYSQSVQQSYNERLFHGVGLQGIQAVDGCSSAGIVARARVAPAPSEWLRQPQRRNWIADPLALDCAFQLLILWSWEQLAAGSLPVLAGSYRQFARRFPQDGVRIVGHVREHTPQRVIADLEFVDANGALVARLDGYECVVDESLAAAFRKQ
ncbi:MAG: SDR family NAD(P)-dependent oxidoreductase [Planctomycetota bacterium]